MGDRSVARPTEEGDFEAVHRAKGDLRRRDLLQAVRQLLRFFGDRMSAPFPLRRVAAGWLFLLPCVAAADNPAVAPPSCPRELPASSIQIRAGAEWRPFVEFSLPLHSASMSSGPPESLSQLRGVDLHQRGEPPSTLYEFGKVGYERGKWLACNYGEAGELTISRRLDDSLTACTITHFKGRANQPRRIDVSCK